MKHFDLAQCKQKGFAPIIIVLAVLVLAGIAGGAYYLGKSASFPQAQPIIQPVPTVITQPNQSADETANWKTYKSEKYGFEIKYPATWLVNSKDNIVRFQTFSEPSPGYGGFPGDTNDIQVSLSIKDNSGNLTLEKYFAQQSSGRVIKSKKSIVLGNISGIMVTYDEEVGAGMPEIYSIINNSLIEGTVSGGSGAKEKAISTFDQILSTFKFTN